jgi:hypothetical protein
MIKFRKLSDDHPDLNHSPLLRAAILTLRYVQDHGPISLTKTKAFKRVFVHWAAEHFDWPGRGHEDLLRTHKVLNEYDFPPLELLHFLMIHLRLGRHFKGEFRLTKRGAELAQSPGKLFDELIPFYILSMDHAAYSRFDDRPMGVWDIWLNVINVEADQGSSERDLYAALYSDGADWDNTGWRQLAAFSACVLRPLEWSGLIMQTREKTADSRNVHHVFKTPLWRSALKLDTDDILEPVQMH